MLNVLEGFSIIAIVIAVGYIVSTIKILDPNTGPILNRFAFFAALPALMFKVLSTANLQIIFSTRLAIAGISFFSVALIYALIIWCIKKPANDRLTIGAASSALINANNMGLPVAIYVVGDAAQVAPILLFQLIVVTPLLLTILDFSTRGRVSVRDILMQPVRNPLILGSFLGVLVNVLNVQTPKPIAESVSILGGAGVPLVLVAFGMSLNGTRPFADADVRLEIVVAILGKLVAMPVLVYLLARFVFHMDSSDIFAATMLACLPTAQNTFNYASRYQTNTILARDVVLLTTVLSLPVMLISTMLVNK